MAAKASSNVRTLFQFQLGAINSVTRQDLDAAIAEFQFQLGAINSESALLNVSCDARFNSN